MTYLGTKFEVAMSNRLGGDAFTRNMTHRRTDRRTTDRLWYEINIPFFLKKKAGIKTTAFEYTVELQWAVMVPRSFYAKFTLDGWNYTWLELFFMVPSLFKTLNFYLENYLDKMTV